MGMGLRSDHVDNFIGQKTNLVKVPINNGGYDKEGNYWGVGMPLWHAYCEDDGDTYIKWYDCYFRANNREDAKKYLPGARFYR